MQCQIRQFIILNSTRQLIFLITRLIKFRTTWAINIKILVATPQRGWDPQWMEITASIIKVVTTQFKTSRGILKTIFSKPRVLIFTIKETKINLIKLLIMEASGPINQGLEIRAMEQSWLSIREFMVLFRPRDQRWEARMVINTWREEISMLQTFLLKK